MFYFRQSKQIGEIAFVLSLEDWGPIGTQQIVVAQPETAGVYILFNFLIKESFLGLF